MWLLNLSSSLNLKTFLNLRYDNFKYSFLMRRTWLSLSTYYKKAYNLNFPVKDEECDEKSTGSSAVLFLFIFSQEIRRRTEFCLLSTPFPVVFPVDFPAFSKLSTFSCGKLMRQEKESFFHFLYFKCFQYRLEFTKFWNFCNFARIEFSTYSN